MIKFYYGTMGAGKTTELIKTFEIYDRKGLNPVIIKPAIDTREGNFHGWGFTQSRITKKKVPAFYYTDIREIEQFKNKTILVDEAQFCKKEDVLFLSNLSDQNNINLLAYGLKTDINGNLFEGSITWLAIAEEIKELENLCEVNGCMNKAIMHKRFINGKPDKSSASVVINTDNISYLAVCRKHWKEL